MGDLTDLGIDLLAAILGKLPDTRSRAAAAAASKALWRASCLPGAGGGAKLPLDLDKWEKNSGALWILNGRGSGLVRVQLSLQHGTCSLAQTRQRLAPLLSQLPALRDLSLHSQHLAVLSVVAASLPQLQQLTIGPSNQGAALILPECPSGLQELSCLQRLVVSVNRLQSRWLGPLLREIETLASLTELLLLKAVPTYIQVEQTATPGLEGAWSPQLTNLQRLQRFRDELGLRLPLELAGLPELRSIGVRCYSWQEGTIVCALRGLTSLTVFYSGRLYDDYATFDPVPDPAGLEQALSTLQELRWEMPADGLWDWEQFTLERLTSLTVQAFEAFYGCLLWTPVCRLQRLDLEEIGAKEGFDLSDLSPLTSLTFLSVSFFRVLWGADELQLPGPPCLAKLQVLQVSYAGLTCVPVELGRAARLRELELYDPDLRITRWCVATLTALRELVHFDVGNDLRGWDKDSAKNLRLLRRARPDMRVET